MARTIRRLLVPSLLLMTAAFSARVSAETDAVRVAIGQSAASLYGPWKFAVGDSPVDPKTGKPLWAEPGFDDSKWENVDLTPLNGAIDPVAGTTHYVPGWTARGHRGYWGYAWYRIRVQLSTEPQEDLALSGPADVDDGYQVFANGELLGSFGDFSGKKPVIYYTRPIMFALTTPTSTSANSNSLVLAFRLWMDPSTLFTSPDAGGMHSAPILGAAESVAMANRIRWVEVAQAYGATVAAAFLFALLAIVSFSLLLFDPSDRVYFWLAGIFLLSAIDSCLGVIDTWNQFLSGVTDTFLAEVFLLPLAFVGWVMVWWVWFRLNRPSWLPKSVALLALIYIGSNLIGQGYFGAFVSQPLGTTFHVISWLVRLVCIGLMLWIVVQGIRREGTDGWLVLPAVILVGIARFTRELRLMHVRTNWYPFGIRIRLVDLANFLLVAVLALLLLRRLLLSVRNQRRLSLDVKQAQEVQQVILPEARTVVPGLVIEAEYRPALEVGGDFFQIIPHKSDGSLLIVAGDVTGKGLKAGMLVALLVGAIRTTAESDPNPANVLETLNRRLVGRGDAHATCLALRIEHDGRATLADAGHPPPFLNGEPIEIEGSLPLGMLDQFKCSVLNFRMSPSDHLLMLSDGVAEATNAEGQLFGFSRVVDLIRSQPSAREIAEIAQTFGQEDDISVISVTRVPVATPVAV